MGVPWNLTCAVIAAVSLSARAEVAKAVDEICKGAKPDDSNCLKAKALQPAALKAANAGGVR